MAASSTPAPAGPSARPKLTLDEARDFLYTSMRTLERFSSELKGTVDALDGLKQNGAWLDTAQEQFAKGARLMDDQARQWQQTTARMEAYMSSVRDLADQLALQELKGASGDAEGQAEDARFVHPELHRFKLEKIAKIVGKYGGSPALGAMVMPRLNKDTILTATASPAAREIQYSKAEDKDAAQLAEVMRFKTAGREQGLSGWQEELGGLKGSHYVQDQQAKGAASTSTTPGARPVNADLADALAARQHVLQASAEQEAASSTAAKAKTATNMVTGELAAKLAQMQQAHKAGADDPPGTSDAATPSTGPRPASSRPPNPLATPLTNELSQVLLRRKANATGAGEGAEGGGSGGGGSAGASSGAGGSAGEDPTTPWQQVRLQPRAPAAETSPTFRPPPVPSDTPELLARFQKMNKDGDDNDSGAAQ